MLYCKTCPRLLNLKHYQGMRIIDAGEALRALAQ
jgi:hypothetical protein